MGYKYIWEIEQRCFLFLSHCYAHTKQPKYLEKFEELLSAWMDQNPFMMGVNWSSSLELGIRLINWTVCWHLVERDIRPELRKRWLECVYKHCWFIGRNLSRFSSANNHLIGEAAGLFIASTAMPRFKASGRWREKARRILICESMKQNYPDGVNKEQAIAITKVCYGLSGSLGTSGTGQRNQLSADYQSDHVEKCRPIYAVMEDAGGQFAADRR